MVHSTKLAVLAGMVRVNAWEEFTRAWRSYRGKVDLLIYQPLLTNLLDLIEWAIEPITRPIGFQRFFKNEPSLSSPILSQGTKNELQQFTSLEG